MRGKIWNVIQKLYIKKASSLSQSRHPISGNVEILYLHINIWNTAPFLRLHPHSENSVEFSHNRRDLSVCIYLLGGLRSDGGGDEGYRVEIDNTRRATPSHTHVPHLLNQTFHPHPQFESTIHHSHPPFTMEHPCSFRNTHILRLWHPFNAIILSHPLILPQVHFVHPMENSPAAKIHQPLNWTSDYIEIYHQARIHTACSISVFHSESSKHLNLRIFSALCNT